MSIVLPEVSSAYVRIFDGSPCFRVVDFVMVIPRPGGGEGTALLEGKLDKRTHVVGKLVPWDENERIGPIEARIRISEWSLDFNNGGIWVQSQLYPQYWVALAVPSDRYEEHFEVVLRKCNLCYDVFKFIRKNKSSSVQRLLQDVCDFVEAC